MTYRLVFGLFLLANYTAPAFGVVNTVTEISLSDDQVSDAFHPRRLALFIGINDFKDDRFRSLQFANKDVQDFQSFLDRNNRNEHDVSLTLFNEDATTTHLLAALDELEKKNTSEDDIVIVYLSTHGTLDYEDARNLKRYAVTYDTNFQQVAKTGISMEYLQTRLSRLKSSRKALVLALCHSGSGKSQLPETLQSELSTMKSGFFSQPLHEVSSAMMVLSASSWGQPAREDNFLQNDIYTHFLIDGLDKHDSNQDGAVSLFEAHEYARSRTYDYTRGQQTPSALLNIAGTDPIILKGQVKKEGQPMIFADSEGFRNVQLLVDGQSKGTLWQPQKIPEGRVRLTLLDPQNPQTPMVDHFVYVNRSQALPVSRLFQRTPSTGLEMRVQRLPLPSAVADQGDLWAPGIYLRSSEILGTTLSAGLGFMTHNWESQVDIDYVTSRSHLQVNHARLDVGMGFYPSKHQTVSFALGAEALSLKRTIDNPSFAERQQTSFTVYPSITVDWRYLSLWESLYVGTYASLLPSKKAGFTLDQTFASLDPWSAGGLMGFTF